MIGKALRATVVSVVAATFILVAIHVLNFVNPLLGYGSELTLYYGRALDIYTIVTWLMASAPSSHRIANYISVLVSWSIAWFVASDWIKDKLAVLVSVLLTYLAFILYLAAWRHAVILIYIPESLVILYGALIAFLFSFLRDKISRRMSFFELLEREGFNLSSSEREGFNVPIKCRRCGTVTYSSSKFCWNCGYEAY